MRKVCLRMNESKKYEEIKKLVDNGGNKKRVQLILGLTKRQINRLIHIRRKEKRGLSMATDQGNLLKPSLNLSPIIYLTKICFFCFGA